MTRKQYVDPFASDEDDSQNPSPEKPSTTSAKTPERDQPLEDTYDVVTKRVSNTPAVSVSRWAVTSYSLTVASFHFL